MSESDRQTPEVTAVRPTSNLYLYQPPSQTQLLPYERMLSTALITWFKLNGHDLPVIEKTNAEQMSPTGLNQVI
jgi:hypothetical protein